jgi:predicted Zn-dependent protease
MTNTSTKIVTGILLMSAAVLVQPQPVSAAANWGNLFKGVMDYSKKKEEANYLNKDGSGEAAKMFKEKDGVDNDPNKNEQLKRIMTSLTNAIGKKEKMNPEYKYWVNQRKDFNAYCGIGHNVSVNSGLFDELQNDEDEIAFVLAHELVHGQKNHSVNKQDKVTGINILTGVLASKTNNSQAGDITNKYLVATQATLPGEWEADNVGFNYAMEAGYNPGAGAAIWTKIMEKYGDNHKDFFNNVLDPSDHPTNKQRINNYSKKLTEYSKGKVVYDPSTACIMVNKKEWFKVATSGGKSANERGYLIAGKLARAIHNSNKLEPATAVDGNIMIGSYQIATPNQGEKSPEAAAQALNTVL